MPRKFYSHKHNKYFSVSRSETLTTILHQDDVVYTDILLGHPPKGWDEDIDLFKFLNPNLIDDLRSDNIILIVEYTFEGFSKFEHPIIAMLEKNAISYKINPKKIFYCSGNLKDHSDLINCVPIYTLDHPHHYGRYRREIYSGNNIDSVKNTLKEKFDGKICLSLSRRNRYHRVLGHCMLSNSEIADHCLISQDKVKKFNLDENTLSKIGLDHKSIKKFLKGLPLIADHDRFNKNEPFDPLFQLHRKTIFSVVNETSNDDWNESCLFFSEKILKPIINFQPMIIWGQKNINRNLEELGFKTYESYFDLDFDSEPDNILRYKKLLDSIIPVVKSLAEKDIEEKVNWRFKNKELLEYNYNVFLENYHSKKQKEIFLEKIRSVFIDKYV
jgi:hypothetical protein